jgi:hypothetical protein
LDDRRSRFAYWHGHKLFAFSQPAQRLTGSSASKRDGYAYWRLFPQDQVDRHVTLTSYLHPVSRLTLLAARAPLLHFSLWFNFLILLYFAFLTYCLKFFSSTNAEVKTTLSCSLRHLPHMLLWGDFYLSAWTSLTFSRDMSSC